MPSNIQLKIEPAPGVALPKLPPGLVAEVTYLRAGVNGDGAEPAVSDTRRVAIDAGFTAMVVLEHVTADALEVAFLADDGSTLHSGTVQAVNNAALVSLTAADLSAITTGPQQVAPGAAEVPVTRAVRLVSTGGAPIDFRRSSAVVAPVKDATAFAAGPAALLGGAGAAVSTIDLTGKDAAPLRALAWQPAQVAVDGTLTATFRREKTLGWLWWLVGDHQVFGFVPDDLSIIESRPLMVPLPVLALAPTNAGGSSAIPPQECTCRHPVSADVTEAELANNPGVYTEDPGSFCKPFSSPERVVGERSFSVIARVAQPSISARPSVKTKSMALLSFDEDEGRDATGAAPGLVGRLVSAFRAPPPAGTAMARATMLATPTRHIIAPGLAGLLGNLGSGRATMDADHPLQWEDDISQYQAATVALGHILEFRVRWRSNGYSLGTVAKSLTLAPRQVKRIQKIEWERSERARRTETSQLRDQENDSVVRERDYSDMVTAHLDEWSRGESRSGTKAIAGGLGFFASGIVGGIGGGASSASSTSKQEGGRDTTASEQQRLRDAIRRHGDALRRMESTVVMEVSQEESVTGTTEVIRNPNYGHSLTVIYYQILRHLKVTTDFAGARECLFVPFAIKPFDVQRAYRWRESIQASIRSPLYSRALRHLKDVATNFATSDIPAGPRANQRLTHVRGSLYVNLAVERPRDAVDGAYDAARWGVLAPLLTSPAQGIFSILAGLGAAERDRQFQANYAAGIAAKWADRLRVEIGGQEVRADCTLASRYQFNRGVRIDFVIPASELGPFTRNSLLNLRILAGQGLPPGSVANLTRLTVTYNTAKFERGVEGRAGVDDLVVPGTGDPDSATAFFPLDDWEKVDERLEIQRAVGQLIAHLNEHVEYYHKAIWWRMDRDRLLMMLDGFYVPNSNGVSIATVVDREPVGIIGNCLVYRVGAASFIGQGSVKTSADLYNLYAPREPVRDPLLISLPTDGLYAQAIMDPCPALEEHYGNTDWVLTDQEPDLGTIDPSLLQTRRTDPTAAVTPSPFPATIINLQNAPDAPAPSGLTGVLNAVTNPNAFRDMAGLAGTQANAMGALTAATGLANSMASQAAQVEMAKLAKAEQATKTADQKMASIKNAVDKGLATPADAAQAAKETLAAMNPDAQSSAAPHQDAMINSMIGAARGAPGSVIEAATGAGAVKVTMGDAGALLASAREPLREQCGFFGTSAVQTEAAVRDAVRVAAEAERALWFTAAGTAAFRESDASQFGHLIGYWLSRTGDVRPSALTALIAAATGGAVNYGPLLVAATNAATVTAEVARVRAELLAASGVAAAGVFANLDQAIRDARESGIITPANTRTAWSAVFISAAVRRAAIGLGLEGESGTTHIGKNGLLLASSGHRVFVVEADRRTKAGIDGTYHAFDVPARPVQVGDIIVQDRQANAIGDVWTFANIPALAGGRQMHTDIVVAVDVVAGDCTAIGGNLSDGVRRRRYPLAADGTLVVQETQRYVGEDAAGNLPALPNAVAAGGQLNGESTGRIFAVLSLEEDCAVMPGSALGSGLVA